MTFWIYKQAIFHLCDNNDFRCLYTENLTCQDCGTQVPAMLSLGSNTIKVPSTVGKQNTFLGAKFMAITEYNKKLAFEKEAIKIEVDI